MPASISGAGHRLRPPLQANRVGVRLAPFQESVAPFPPVVRPRQLLSLFMPASYVRASQHSLTVLHIIARTRLQDLNFNSDCLYRDNLFCAQYLPCYGRCSTEYPSLPQVALCTLCRSYKPSSVFGL